MRPGIAVTILFVLYIAASILTQGYISRSADAMMQQAEEVRGHIQSEDWDTASEGIKALNGQWETHKSRWLMLEEHDKIDEIDEAIRSAMNMIELQETPHSMESMGRFIFHVSDVPDKGRFEFANIF
jgi:hypothetical protein